MCLYAHQRIRAIFPFFSTPPPILESLSQFIPFETHIMQDNKRIKRDVNYIKLNSLFVYVCRSRLSLFLLSWRCNVQSITIDKWSRPVDFHFEKLPKWKCYDFRGGIFRNRNKRHIIQADFICIISTNKFLTHIDAWVHAPDCYIRPLIVC